ncbi:hypothetical protein V6Z11_A03G064600 [Gossypium hirsutum]
MGEEVKFHGMWASPFSRRVELALKLKAIPYQYIEEDLSNKTPSLLRYNPVHKKVPVLVHNDKPVAESMVIIEYMDETWENNPILPRDPYERAMARFYAKFIDDKVYQISTLFSFNNSLVKFYKRSMYYKFLTYLIFYLFSTLAKSVDLIPRIDRIVVSCVHVGEAREAKPETFSQ